MRLFVYCAGGFGRETMDVARRINKEKNRWGGICFIDDGCFEKEIYGASVFTLDQVLLKFGVDSFEVLIANGEPFVRKAIYDKLKGNNIKLATIVDSSAIVSDTATLGEGVTIPAHCFVSSSARIGNNTTLNTGALVGHEVTISENCVITSAVNIAGSCVIGDNTYIGMGSQIKQGITIGKGVIIGMGSIVYNNIPDGVIALGNPARPMKSNTSERVFK